MILISYCAFVSNLMVYKCKLNCLILGHILRVSPYWVRAAHWNNWPESNVTLRLTKRFSLWSKFCISVPVSKKVRFSPLYLHRFGILCKSIRADIKFTVQIFISLMWQIAWRILLITRLFFINLLVFSSRLWFVCVAIRNRILTNARVHVDCNHS